MKNKKAFGPDELKGRQYRTRGTNSENFKTVMYLNEKIDENGIKTITLSFDDRNEVKERKLALICLECKRIGFLEERVNEKEEKVIVPVFNKEAVVNAETIALLHLETKKVIGFLEERTNEKGEKITCVYPNDVRATLVEADDCNLDINIENRETIKYVYCGINGDEKEVENKEKINVRYEYDKNEEEYNVEVKEKITYEYLSIAIDENMGDTISGQSGNCSKKAMNRSCGMMIPAAYMYKEMKEDKKFRPIYLNDKAGWGVPVAYFHKRMNENGERVPIAYLCEEMNENGERVPVAYEDIDKGKRFFEIYLHKDISRERKDLEALDSVTHCIINKYKS